MSSSYDNITRLNLFSVRVNQSEKKKEITIWERAAGRGNNGNISREESSVIKLFKMFYYKTGNPKKFQINPLFKSGNKSFVVL